MAISRNTGQRPKKCEGRCGNCVPTGKTISSWFYEYSGKRVWQRESAMNSSSAAPVRQTVPEVPESNIPDALVPAGTQDPGENSVVYLRLLWGHRTLLF